MVMSSTGNEYFKNKQQMVIIDYSKTGDTDIAQDDVKARRITTPDEGTGTDLMLVL